MAEVVNGLTSDEPLAPATGGDPIADCFDYGGNPVPFGGGSFTLAKIRNLFLVRDYKTASVPWSGDLALQGQPLDGRDYVAKLVQPPFAAQLRMLEHR